MTVSGLALSVHGLLTKTRAIPYWRNAHKYTQIAAFIQKGVRAQSPYPSCFLEQRLFSGQQHALRRSPLQALPEHHAEPAHSR